MVEGKSNPSIMWGGCVSKWTLCFLPLSPQAATKLKPCSVLGWLWAAAQVPVQRQKNLKNKHGHDFLSEAFAAKVKPSLVSRCQGDGPQSFGPQSLKSITSHLSPSRILCLSHLCDSSSRSQSYTTLKQPGQVTGRLCHSTPHHPLGCTVWSPEGQRDPKS